MLNLRFNVLTAIILAGALARILPHAPNFTPIGALALFAGTQFANKRLAFVVPILAMILSDMILGLHSGIASVYGSFLCSVCLGFWLRDHRNIRSTLLVSLINSLLFFIITNFSVWFSGGMYPASLQGFIRCYVAALPFLRNTVSGDLFYVALFFGGLSMAEKRWPNLSEIKTA
jgi:hypothetical protein